MFLSWLMLIYPCPCPKHCPLDELPPKRQTRIGCCISCYIMPAVLSSVLIRCLIFADENQSFPIVLPQFNLLDALLFVILGTFSFATHIALVRKAQSYVTTETFPIVTGSLLCFSSKNLAKLQTGFHMVLLCYWNSVATYSVASLPSVFFSFFFFLMCSEGFQERHFSLPASGSLDVASVSSLLNQ